MSKLKLPRLLAGGIECLVSPWDLPPSRWHDICKDWAVVKDKAKSLEHIIRKCDPPTTAMPLVTTGATVPGLYLHITHWVDKDEEEIPPPFKGEKPK